MSVIVSSPSCPSTSFSSAAPATSTWRKLMPALFQAWRHGKLPAGGRILAVARDDLSDDSYRAWLKERFTEVEDAKRPSDDEFARFAELLHYLRLDLSQPSDYARLKTGSRAGRPRRPCRHRRAVPRDQPAPVPGQICAQLGAVGAERTERPRRAREAARPRPRERAGDQPRRRARCSARSRRSASTTTSASRRCRT